nr:copia protein [Tanacetum cinerariifolium]
MILNTLDNLGKFEEKGDEGYFLGYSMSSKAFRIFNKRTKRVEENVHIEFLENKAIEKGSGPNWFFDIDSLTKSMNYVPVVDAGTHSTNFSESTSSQPQGTRNTDVPESSGNSNPTATLTNPPDDQLETLTVETPIPTASSLVLTVCFTDSQEPLRHTQEEGIDYDEVFAPVARIKAIRLFFAYASFMGLTVYQMDVNSAFLYGTINEEVYLMQPHGFQDPEYPARVYKVEKAIEFEALMHEKLQMSAMGKLNFFLGLLHTAKTLDLVWIWLGGDYENIFLNGF